ncbi:hypothetical protein B0T19DRAFT_436053 [Cercophora scortea]|uniref:Uncharacterized protein n=1 Tax=Cercophora scortea TaxID=314031 RepID=A0AAE0J1G3_9PEZI|nr:hypothetical protein B0T19DRAFT_436053 [Cercophora scortea]
MYTLAVPGPASPTVVVDATPYTPEQTTAISPAVLQASTLHTTEQPGALRPPMVRWLFRGSQQVGTPSRFRLENGPDPQRMPGRSTVLDIPMPRRSLHTDRPISQANHTGFREMPEYYLKYTLLHPSRGQHRAIRKLTALQKFALAIAAFSTIAPAVAITLRITTDAVIYITAGVSIAASASIPPLRSAEDVAAAYWISAYCVWSVAFSMFFILELARRPNWLQCRLMLGMVLFSGLNLLGSLAQSASTMLVGVTVWGPLALTASLCVVPVLIEFMQPPGPRAGLVADVIKL